MKRERAQSRIWKSTCRFFNFLFLFSSSNLFHCLFYHLLYSKTTQTSHFLMYIKLYWHFFTTLSLFSIFYKNIFLTLKIKCFWIQVCYKNSIGMGTYLYHIQSDGVRYTYHDGVVKFRTCLGIRLSHWKTLTPFTSRWTNERSWTTSLAHSHKNVSL